ncbi:outer membrane lipoprotein Omp10 [Pararhizobium sp. PWRC1-1]|uniref:outer membrane lipoprotein Omp10 n=1 Tax=Pararhizobium sp. PWRC1-1 TaxID=2804566 RepID=UPI003CFB6E4E
MKPIAILTVLSAAALASCQGGGQVRELPQNRQMAPVGVQGAWVDPNGVVSTFTGGTFSTRTTDTNQEIASGTYTNLSPQLVEINMYSVLRKTQSKVNCAMVSMSQLNCTTDSGAQFSLSRKV